jgi:adenylate cyclase
MPLLAELKRRNVIRTGVAWLALSWLLVAMCALLFPALDLPITALRWLILALLVAAVPVLLLSWRYELTPSGFKVDSGAARDNPQRPITARRLDQMIVIVVLAALSLSLLRQFIDQARPDPESAAPAVSTAAPVPVAPRRPASTVDGHSLAVLPFVNMSQDVADSYFADGLSEELLNVLARVDGLKVTSRTSSFVFRDSHLDIGEIAAQLGVAYVLEGSVRRDGEQVRITVQLIDARNSEHVWAENYERRLVEIFRVQEEISQSIADALADSLGVRRIEVADATADIEAYETYLRGRQLFAQRGANLPAARELLEQAVARDPQFADAWATLAATWYVWRAYAPEPEGVDTLEWAEIAAEKALAIRALHPGALAVSARIAGDRGDRLRHAELIEQALALAPNSANTRVWQGLGLFEVGHIEQAQSSFAQAQKLDPLSGLPMGWLGIATDLRGDHVAGRQLLQRAHALGWRGPASRALFFLAGSGDDGADLTQTYLDWLHDDDSMPIHMRELARSLAPALTDAAQLASAQLRLLEAASAAPDLEWAILLQIFDLPDAAIANALRIPAARSQTVLFSLWYPKFSSFRDHARFPEFARLHGLIAYWEKLGTPDGCTLVEAAEQVLRCE